MKKNLFLSLSCVVLLALMVYAVTLGSVYIKPELILRSILEWIKYGMDGVTCDDSIRFIIFEVRLPRIILAVLTGSLLSMAGAVYQAIFQNPMADPYVIGISSGAAFGATIAIIFLPPMMLLGNSIVSLAAFLSAILTSILVYFISKTKRGVDTFSLLLTGVVISTVLSSFISLMMLAHKDEAMKIMTWTMGSFNAKSWNHVLTILIPTVIGIFFTIYHGKDLNILVMGEEEAMTMGLDTKRLKRNMLLICALLTSIAVSVSGIIGFVGLIVPHFIRLIFGSEHKFLLKASFVFGAIFMLLSDTIARSLIDGFEVPVGIITSLIGGPLFLILLVRYRRNLK
ncbi:MAG: iron ABC transporter permease [Eubacteriales bacterium]|uniref:FecCD family ABC transporter permease n=1 Tax=Fenollaria sp. TaxID=1965292 RepID=UPI002A75A07E|nr:iron ABC transporter permease [Fenollaria sp.]MDD7340101.1 iron ABC transporter permease [Eubacteriales bacterium]MDY3105931.1 iron ABC transporter permease [Fenollaria sp.]